MEEQKELLVANQAEEKVEETISRSANNSSNAKVYEFDELLEDNAEPQKESEEIEMNEVVKC
jgi:hypothetical protein